jgi:hypothetical protein
MPTFTICSCLSTLQGLAKILPHLPWLPIGSPLLSPAPQLLVLGRPKGLALQRLDQVRLVHLKRVFDFHSHS